jgi:hypothetical protein
VTASSSWLTPTVSDGKPAGPTEIDMVRRWESGESVPDTYKRLRGQVVARLYPTPRASDGAKGGPNQRGSKGDLTLPSFVAKNIQRTGLPGLPTDAGKPIGRQLSPRFVEWLMGFPDGWTDLEGSATP